MNSCSRLSRLLDEIISTSVNCLNRINKCCVTVPENFAFKINSFGSHPRAGTMGSEIFKNFYERIPIQFIRSFYPEKISRKFQNQTVRKNPGSHNPFLLPQHLPAPGSSDRQLVAPVKVKGQEPFSTQLAVLRHFPASGGIKIIPGILRVEIRAHCIVFSPIRYFSGQ